MLHALLLLCKNVMCFQPAWEYIQLETKYTHCVSQQIWRKPTDVVHSFVDTWITEVKQFFIMILLLWPYNNVTGFKIPTSDGILRLTIIIKVPACSRTITIQ